MLSVVMGLQGEFQNDVQHSVVKEGVLELALPFLPWARKGQLFATNRHALESESSSFGAQISANLKRRKLEPPYTEVVPRLGKIRDVSSAVNLWRRGNPDQHIPPLLKMLNSDSRKEIWPGYCDQWWKASGNKAAFLRVKHIISLVVELSDRSCDISGRGTDPDWEAAIASFENRWGKHTLFRILRNAAPK